MHYFAPLYRLFIHSGTHRKNYMKNLFPEDYPNFDEFGPAPCSESFPDAFFTEEPPEGMMKKHHLYAYEREAKAICARCPYARRCLEFAMKDPDKQGIWGGTTERQRTALRRGGITEIGKAS